MHHPQPEPAGREIEFVDVASGARHRYVLPRHVTPNLSSGALTPRERLLIHDEGLPAAYNQALAVMAAAKVVEAGTARQVPVRLAQLLLQELDRVNAIVAAQARRLEHLATRRQHDGPATL